MKSRKISIKDFEQEVDSVEALCNEWLSCSRETIEALEVIRAYRRQALEIAGFSEFADDHDWNTIDLEFRSRCDLAIEKWKKTNRLAAAARLAFENVSHLPREMQTASARAYYFGKASLQIGWAPELK